MAGGMLGLDRPGLLDGSAEKEQLFRQRGLAGIRMTDNSEGPSPADFFLSIIAHYLKAYNFFNYNFSGSFVNCRHVKALIELWHLSLICNYSFGAYFYLWHTTKTAKALAAGACLHNRF
jgi:hypothetical protein